MILLIFVVFSRNLLKIDSISFLDENMIKSLIFKLIDFDSDNLISANDLALFLGSLPNELCLFLDQSSEEEKSYTFHEFLIRIKFRRNIEIKKNIINIRGNNYETINFQLPLICETIISAFSKDEQTNFSRNSQNFELWLQANSDLLEYFFNTICPLGWISHTTIQSQCFTKISCIFLIIPYILADEKQFSLSRLFALLYMKNDNSFANFITLRFPDSENQKKSKSFSSKCFDCIFPCFTRSARVSPETFSFERGYRKKGSLLFCSDENFKNETYLLQNSCILIYKFNCLYIQLENSFFASNYGIFAVFLSKKRYYFIKKLLYKRSASDNNTKFNTFRISDYYRR